MASIVARRTRSWRPEQPVGPADLEAILDAMDLGAEGGPAREAREATLRYLTDLAVQAACTGVQLRVGHVEAMASAFYQGYLTCHMERTRP